jgi:hypothetical protein
MYNLAAYGAIINSEAEVGITLSTNRRNVRTKIAQEKK